LASNPVSHARTKHIKVDVHFIREKVTNRDIQLCYLSTLGQVADLFTKGLTIDRFFLLRDKLPIVPPIRSRGGVKGTIVNTTKSRTHRIQQTQPQFQPKSKSLTVDHIKRSQP
jgi:hypothetical protein